MIDLVNADSRILSLAGDAYRAVHNLTSEIADRPEIDPRIKLEGEELVENMQAYLVTLQEIT